MSALGVDEDLTFIDEFCGAGGSSIGLTAAGFELKLAINHWERAIETHSSNFRDADHWCEDTSKLSMRRLPRARVLWASPICTEVSPAGGRKRRRKVPPGQSELELFGHVPKAGMERTRTTFYDVLRSVEVRRFDAVLVENVVDVAYDWELFDWWVEAMACLGYNVQFVSVSTAHVGGEDNPHAPQWRDRLYLVFTKIGIPLPDVEPRPLAWCPVCDEDVRAVQTWKNPRKRKIGKYRQQYVYRCPNSACRFSVVEPYVLPAAAAIDWSDLGERIGDRRRPLAAKTVARIKAGLEMFAQPITLEAAGNTFERRPGVRTHPAFGAPLTTLTTDATKGLAVPPVMVSVNHDDGADRTYPVGSRPLPARTVKIGDGFATPPMLVPCGGTWREDADPVDVPMAARTTSETDALVCPPFVTVHRGGEGDLRVRDTDHPLPTVTASGNHLGVVSPPFIAELRGGGSVVRPVDEPLGTVTAGGLHHGLTVPPGAFYVKNYGGHADHRYMCKQVSEPLGVITSQDHHALVVPYYRTGRAKTTASPLDTVTTHDRFGLVDPAIDVADCRFRMLSPREHLRAQAFPDSYIVHGNKGEQTMQAGNAVSANVACWLGRAVAAVLNATRAAA